MKTLGICLGASTISMAQIEAGPSAGGPPYQPLSGRARITRHWALPHDGNPRRCLMNALSRIDIGQYDRIAATGRKFRQLVHLTSIPEPRAVEHAYRFLKPPHIDCPAIVAAGGETFMVYVLDRSGTIANVITGNKCASGTGEFFLQQIRRMNVSLEEAARFAAEETPHPVSGRCSVFCKSDCTHATNKGVPKANVTAGLCLMMANKILELLKNVERRHIMLTGGTSKNHMMVAYLEKKISGLIVPAEAPYFEALGAALWALDHTTRPLQSGLSGLLRREAVSFNSLPPLADFKDRVTFKHLKPSTLADGDICILGLDVGSTTTKAVLMRVKDNAMPAAVYLRTSGDPVGTSRQCYAEILRQVETMADPRRLSIIGLGVCGSGRQIAGLHALTDGVINEIIAHATAAVYFDRQVDTIFEIGGQDAKYTYITNGVPSDYAMNEACSAGTGSFLEESAYESLGIRMEDIAAIACKGRRPPNFNDQCAAFIASDIKNAIHEGVDHDDIVAGLVYSICMNYTNRVKGNRPTGEKIFMQGGVCYNTAVPLAMASLLEKPIVVPPEPGLMGAFGVALEVKKRIERGLMQRGIFDLAVLAERRVTYGRPFICRGGKEKCDRRCRISMIEIEGRRYPFGGACNRYDNIRRKRRVETAKLDLVRLRQQLVFDTHAARRPLNEAIPARGTVGLNRSFLVNTYFPLYSTFFAALGFTVVLPDRISQQGIDRRNAPFCYPGEIAHGFFYTLLEKSGPLDYIFLPHFKAVPSQNGDYNAQVCPLVQGETFFLRSTFRRELDRRRADGTRVLTPLIDLSRGLDSAVKPLMSLAREMNIDAKTAEAAAVRALHRQRDCLADMKSKGDQLLAELAADPRQMAVVIFSRPYNGFAKEAHMGIPGKLASRGVSVVPLDFLPIDREKDKRHMYWGMGQLILQAARFVKRHPQLFGTFITNFSCGPDSFIIGYFRSIMGRKPSLTLELDSHTADAGLDTRIEAFLDIVSAFRRINRNPLITAANTAYAPARITRRKDTLAVVTSAGRTVPLTDPRVTLLIPSMGRIASEAMAAAFKNTGVNALALPPADEAVLKIGRGNTSCKECLPLILTTGSLLNYLRSHRREAEIVVYFMATGSGPCRFGQYFIFMEDLIRRLELPDVAMFTLTSENAYQGLKRDFERRAWWAVITADVMEDVRAMLLADAKDTETAMHLFQSAWDDIMTVLADGGYKTLLAQLRHTADRLRSVELKRPVRDVPLISLTGEIFVRRDGLSRQYLTERLAEMGFATVCTPVAEWVFYSEYLVQMDLIDHRMSLADKMRFHLRRHYMKKCEQTIRGILSRSGLVGPASADVAAVLRHGTPYLSPQLTGEAILTIGGALTDIATHVCGVIAIGPFGCMPNRLSESILIDTMTSREKRALEPHNRCLAPILDGLDTLPFLAVESDGSPFPQLINAKLETFCLRAERLHARMRQG